MIILDTGVTIQNGRKSSFIVEVKDKEDSDPILLELKGVVYNQRVEVFSHGEDGILCYQCRLCVPDISDLRQHIFAEAHNTRYSIHKMPLRCTTISTNSIDGCMKRDMTYFLSKCPNCQQFKVHQ